MSEIFFYFVPKMYILVKMGDIYAKTEGVAMGLPLGPALAGIFMVELE